MPAKILKFELDQDPEARSPYKDTNERIDTCLIKDLSKIKVIRKRQTIPFLK